MKRTWISHVSAIGFALALTAVAVTAHHGWSGYDETKPLTMDGTIESAQYVNPHGLMKFKVDDKVWDIVLAPVTRMQARGLTPAMLKSGTKARVVGYQHRQTTTEVRAENITIEGKKVELR